MSGAEAMSGTTACSRMAGVATGAAPETTAKASSSGGNRKVNGKTSPATNDLSEREHVLSWTAGWGDQMSEDVVFDDGTISISRRYASDTDGGQGRYQADGYYGTMNHAAFGTGFHGYHDWDRDDGSVWDFKVQGTGVQGKISNSQPPGSLTWEGRLVGYQSEPSLPGGSDPFVKGRARVTLGVGSRNDSVDVDIDFDRITSMDGQRTVAAFGFPRHQARGGWNLRWLGRRNGGRCILRSGA